MRTSSSHFCLVIHGIRLAGRGCPEYETRRKVPADDALQNCTQRKTRGRAAGGGALRRLSSLLRKASYSGAESLHLWYHPEIITGKSIPVIAQRTGNRSAARENWAPPGARRGRCLRGDRYPTQKEKHRV